MIEAQQGPIFRPTPSEALATLWVQLPPDQVITHRKNSRCSGWRSSDLWGLCSIGYFCHDLDFNATTSCPTARRAISTRRTNLNADANRYTWSNEYTNPNGCPKTYTYGHPGSSPHSNKYAGCPTTSNKHLTSTDCATIDRYETSIAPPTYANKLQF